MTRHRGAITVAASAALVVLAQSSTAAAAPARPVSAHDDQIAPIELPPSAERPRPVVSPSPEDRSASDAPPLLGEERSDPALEVDGRDVQDVENIEELGLEGLLDMELKEQLGTTSAVSRSEEDVLRAPATLTTLDSEQIVLSGATTVPDLLRRVPGVQVTHAAPGHDVVALRGTGGTTGNNVIVTIDGVPINSPLDANVDWDLVPIAVADIERIEVVRGPVSTIYGANAYTGVINIVTKETIGLSPDWAIRAFGGTDLRPGPVTGTSARVVHRGERVDAKWFGRFRYDDTYARTPGGFDHPPQLSASTLGSVRARFGERGAFNAELGGAFSRRTSLDLLVQESEPTDRGMVFGRIGVGWSDLPGVIDSVEWWGRDRAIVIRTSAGDYDGFSFSDTNGNRAETGLDLGFDLHEKVEARLGGQATLDWIDAPYVNEGVVGFHPGGGFYAGLSVYPTKHLDITVAGRGDVPPEIGRLAGSYRGSIVYHRDTWSLRGSASSAFRAPTYVEAGGRFTEPDSGFILLEGRPDLDTPSVGAAELAATVAPLRTLSIAPVVYASSIRDAIVTDFEPLVLKTFDNDKTTRWLVGGELEIRWKFSDALTVAPAAGAAGFITRDDDRIPTIAVPEQNSIFTGSLRAYGTLLRESLGYGAGVRTASPRAYRLSAGIPPRVLDVEVPWTAELDGMVEYHLRRTPVWLSLRILANLPNQVVEAPYLLAAGRGSTFMLGVEVRRQ